MKKQLLTLITLLNLSASGAINATSTDLLIGGTEQPSSVFVNNRILAQVNGKAVSVMDIMKKMDMLFYKQYPQYITSAPARFQFYQVHWKQVLKDIIDKEIILADAEENKLPLSQADVRQEMETLFGPNIILNLDKIGLTFEEALKMVQDELTIQRMMHIRAISKAMKRVTPQVVKSSYEQFAAANVRPEQWIYTVVSIRNPDPAVGIEAANFAHQFLLENGTLTELPEIIKNSTAFGKSTKVTVSETLKHETKDLNEDYRKALSNLSNKTYSQPIAQKSRTAKEKVFRIFYLQEHTAEGQIPFQDLAKKIKDELLNIAITEEISAYLERLRNHYHVESCTIDLASDEFAPFVLK